MSDSAVALRTRKFMKNPLLARKQFVVEITHPNMPNLSKAKIAERLAVMYKVKDLKCIALFNFKTAFGGGRSTGFGLIYDNLEAAKKFEPVHRLRKSGLAPNADSTRRPKKDNKHKRLKLRSGAKGKVPKITKSSKKNMK